MALERVLNRALVSICYLSCCVFFLMGAKKLLRRSDSGKTIQNLRIFFYFINNNDWKKNYMGKFRVEHVCRFWKSTFDIALNKVFRQVFLTLSSLKNARWQRATDLQLLLSGLESNRSSWWAVIILKAAETRNLILSTWSFYYRFEGTNNSIAYSRSLIQNVCLRLSIPAPFFWKGDSFIHSLIHNNEIKAKMAYTKTGLIDREVMRVEGAIRRF